MGVVEIGKKYYTKTKEQKIKGVFRMYKAMDIAYWFLYKNYAKQREKVAVNDEFDVYESLTHLKLQKLLYNAQGCSLAINNEPLFEEPLEAWIHGPVVSNVYEAFHVFRGEPIMIPVSEESDKAVEKIEADTKTRELLEYVYDEFAIYTAWQLREMSHDKNGPWYKTKRKGEIIDNEAIKEYFKKEVLNEEE